MKITVNSVVSHSRGLMTAPLDPDLVIVNPERDNYIGLDKIGRRVWDLLAAPGAVKDLCLQITREYQGDSQQMTADILSFLNELDADALIDVKEPADVAAT